MRVLRAGVVSVIAIPGIGSAPVCIAWSTNHRRYRSSSGCDPRASTTLPRLALRNTFAGVEPASIRRMVGENAIHFFGLDPATLQLVAEGIDAPTIDELVTPIDRHAVPAGASQHAFRPVRRAGADVDAPRTAHVVAAELDHGLAAGPDVFRPTLGALFADEVEPRHAVVVDVRASGRRTGARVRVRP